VTYLSFKLWDATRCRICRRRVPPSRVYHQSLCPIYIHNETCRHTIVEARCRHCSSFFTRKDMCFIIRVQYEQSLGTQISSNTHPSNTVDIRKDRGSLE
jgi:hypothetical protein